MDEYEYYDYDENGDVEEDDWEVEVENLYVEGKSAIENDITTAREKLKRVIEIDQDHGKWTYKAKKMLLRAAQAERNCERTLAALTDLLSDSWRGRTSAMLEKSIVKFLDRCTTIGIDENATEQILRALVGYVTKHRQSVDKLYFIVHLRLATLEFQAGRFDGLFDRLRSLLAEVTAGENAEIRRGIIIMQFLSLLIMLSETVGNREAFAMYTDQALAIRHAIPPNRIVGVVREAEGRLAVELQHWDRAREAFLTAFRAYDEAGDPKRFTTLMLLLAASILSTTSISPFHTDEGRSYSADASLAVMLELFDACTTFDARAATRLLGDARWTRLTAGDRTVPLMHAPILRRVQEGAILAQCRPYQSVKMATVARMAGLDNADDVRPIVAQLIRRGKLNGRIYALEDVLVMPRRQEVPRVGGNDEAMEQWFEMLKKTHSSITSRLPTPQTFSEM